MSEFKDIQKGDQLFGRVSIESSEGWGRVCIGEFMLPVRVSGTTNKFFDVVHPVMTHITVRFKKEDGSIQGQEGVRFQLYREGEVVTNMTVRKYKQEDRIVRDESPQYKARMAQLNKVRALGSMLSGVRVDEETPAEKCDEIIAMIKSVETKKD